LVINGPLRTQKREEPVVNTKAQEQKSDLKN